MNAYEANLYLPLIAAGFYLVLLILPQIRSRPDKSQTTWLILSLIVSIGWEFALYFENLVPIANFSNIILLLAVCTLAATTAAFLEWQPAKRYLFLGGAAVLTAVLINLLAPNHRFFLPDGRILLTSNGTLAVYLAWGGLTGGLLLATWREYRKTSFPWHANRLLFWFSVLLMLFLGEFIQFFDQLGFILSGQILRALGMGGLAYGVASFRIFDVRARAQRAIAFVIINTLSALPLILSVIIVFQFGSALNRSNDILTSILIALVITLGFFLYQPFRQLISHLVHRYLRGEGVNAGQVVRHYSQAISRTLDVQQISLLIVGTLSELLETNRGTLMLVTELEKGGYEVEPIPAMGIVPRHPIRFSYNDLLINALMNQHQPLLQYELDFNPAFNGLNDQEKSWLAEMTMEVYVPVSSGTEIVGLIGVGPKNSAVPYQPNELELMQTLADQTVVALQNARLFSEINEQNEHIRYLNIDLVDQNEKLEIMDRVKSDFITIASHELRTPLTQVKGYADILSAMNEENALTREQTREIVGHINRATLQLERLITAMLDASQLDVDGMQLTFVKTQLDTVLRLAVEPLIQAMRERRIRLELAGVDELPPIYADFKRLVQAFTNLLGNAVKYTPDSGRISVKAAIVQGQTYDEEFLEILIQDTGIGIDPKFHTLIFEKFFRIGDPQLHSTGSTKFKGAGPGLGLPIAKGVIEAHGGRIWVESEGEDEERLPGSSFNIVLPVRPPGSEDIAAGETAVRPAYLIG
ncbi:MAG: GAF domain-containing protein [Ardenticatenaceae bacterium]|nr:GAF domain-containing protein [Anaerolineales bacterium]MCB8940651.1 GAF domain-containing protein [Ardenticatenaceae bacterium]MCB8971981.1 GAF domain-containing protein [Ardenticatenaceae bacterium]